MIAALAAALTVQVLSFAAREDLDRFVAGGRFTRLVMAHRGPVRPGQKTLLAIFVRNAPPDAVADFQVFASDGRLVLNRPACCRPAREVGRGVWLLEPVTELTLLPSDGAGLYTAVATVRGRKGTERLVLLQ